MASGIIAGAEALKEASKEKKLSRLDRSWLEGVCSKIEKIIRTFKPFTYTGKPKKTTVNYVKVGRPGEGSKRTFSEIRSFESSFTSERALRKKSMGYSL